MNRVKFWKTRGFFDRNMASQPAHALRRCRHLDRGDDLEISAVGDLVFGTGKEPIVARRAGE